MNELDLLDCDCPEPYNVEEKIIIDQHKYIVNNSIKICDMALVEPHFEEEENHLINSSGIQGPKNPIATFCKERNLATTTYLEYQFDYPFRDMLNRIKILLFKYKKDVMHRRRIMASIQEKLRELQNQRLKNKAIKSNYSKYADI